MSATSDIACTATQIKFQLAFQFTEQTGSSGPRLLWGRRVDTYFWTFMDFFFFFRKPKTQALQSSVHPVGAYLRRPSKYETVGGFCETVHGWDETKSGRLGAWVYKRMFQQNTSNWKYVLPSSHCFLWQGRIRAAHTGSLKHQQCRHDNFRKERKPQWSRGEIRGQAGVDSVCAHFSTLLGQLIRVGLIYGCYIPVSSRVVYGNWRFHE